MRIQILILGFKGFILQYRQLSTCGHHALTDTPIKRTVDKSQAKTKYRRLTDINSNYYRLSLKRTVIRGPYSVHQTRIFQELNWLQKLKKEEVNIVSYFSLALLLLSDTTALMFSFRRRTAATSAFCFSTSFSSFSSSFPARRNFPCSTVAWARANLYQTETIKCLNACIYQ